MSESPEPDVLAFAAAPPVRSVLDALAEASGIDLTVESEPPAAADLTDRLAAGTYDCLLVDHDPPAVDALAVVETATVPELPTIVVTTVPFADLPADPLAAGASDYRQVGAETAPEPLLGAIRTAVASREHERALAECERRFEGAFQNRTIAMALVDTEGTIRTVNEEALRFAGLEDESGVVGRSYWESPWGMAGDITVDQHREIIDRVRQGESVVREIRTRDPEHNVVDIQVRYRPVTVDGSVELIVIEGEDTTEAQAKERRLRVLDRVLRHNVRNDLQLIKGHAQILIEDTSDAVGEQARLIDRTVDQLSAQTQLARRMQEVLSVDRTPVPTNDVAAILRNAVEWFRDTYPEVGLETSIPDTQLARATDRIDIAFKQILQNAAEHTDSDAPAVSISLTTTSRDEAAQPDDPAEVVEIRFVDDGPGIPPHEIAALDETMETALEHGSGIGLWCVNWLVEDSGGELSFPPTESGTEILVSLPITEHEFPR